MGGNIDEGALDKAVPMVGIADRTGRSLGGCGDRGRDGGGILRRLVRFLAFRGGLEYNLAQRPDRRQ
jgi:hypothetical protein